MGIAANTYPRLSIDSGIVEPEAQPQQQQPRRLYGQLHILCVPGLNCESQSAVPLWQLPKRSDEYCQFLTASEPMTISPPPSTYLASRTTLFRQRTLKALNHRNGYLQPSTSAPSQCVSLPSQFTSLRSFYRLCRRSAQVSHGG